MFLGEPMRADPCFFTPRMDLDKFNAVLWIRCYRSFFQYLLTLKIILKLFCAIYRKIEG